MWKNDEKRSRFLFVVCKVWAVRVGLEVFQESKCFRILWLKLHSMNILLTFLILVFLTFSGLLYWKIQYRIVLTKAYSSISIDIIQSFLIHSLKQCNYPPETDIAPENRPCQNESSLPPNHPFSGSMLNFGRVNNNSTNNRKTSPPKTSHRLTSSTHKRIFLEAWSCFYMNRFADRLIGLESSPNQSRGEH